MRSEITQAASEDLPQLNSLYEAAFPDEDLRPLVRQLFGEANAMSRVIRRADGPIAHAVVTSCNLDAFDYPVFLLGPVAVHPDRQGQGLGAQLIRDAVGLAKQAKATCICVLGDPAYYGKFGFKQESRIKTPYPLADAWAAAWQSIDLSPETQMAGMLQVPPVWQKPELWS